MDELVTKDSLKRFRSLIDESEKYTDEELIQVLIWFGTMETVFSRIPTYLPPMIRTALVANEIAPQMMARYINSGVLDPIALGTFFTQLAEEVGLRKPDKGLLN